MTHLTYWYGESGDLRSAYTFQKTSQLIPYEEGMEMTEKKLKGIKKKSEDGKKLMKKDAKFVEGFKEMERDRSKDPTERYGYVVSNFLEEYHVLIEEGNDATKENPTKKEKVKTKSTSKSKNAKLKKKKIIKKMKESTQTDKQMKEDPGKLEVDKDGETPKSKKKTTKKRTKKEYNTIEKSRPKKKAKKGEGDDQYLKIPGVPKHLKKENGMDGKDGEAGPAKECDEMAGGVAKIEETRLSAYEEFKALGDVSSHGETDDGSIDMDDLSDDDPADQDYVEETKAKALKKKTPKKKAKTPKDLLKSKEPLKKKVEREEKKSASELKLQKLFKKEQRKFQKCEIEYLPLLRHWDKAIGEKNIPRLTKIYEELLICMEEFSAPFILEYGMNDLMKRSKGYNNELRRQVLKKFKTIYEKMHEEVPEGFKAKKKAEKNVSVEKKTAKVVEEADNSKATLLTKNKQSSEEVGSTTSVSQKPQEVPVTSSSSSKSRNSDLNKDIDSLSTRKARNSDSNKDLASLSTNKPRNSDSNRDITTEPSSQKLKKIESKLEPSSLKLKLYTGKSEKKRFTLGNLMRAGSSSSQSGNGGKKLLSSVDESSTLPSSRSTKKNQSNPTWIIQVASNENYSDENRTFGLEFLQQAALYISGNKAVNYDAIARNIESAVYSWSMRNLNILSVKQDGEHWNNYWNKIHDLAACIGGKRQGGTLAKMISDGKFATPDELVCLDDNDLWNSFKGLPLSNFSN